MLRTAHFDSPAASRRGLTFFEVTVVFIIIAILAAVAFLATRRLTVETQLARVREEHRIISRALQNYFVDHSAFPVQVQGLAPLSQPITYLPAIPRDVFAPRSTSPEISAYAYRSWNDGLQTTWLLISCGPDGDLDYDAEILDAAGDGDRSLSALSTERAPHSNIPVDLIHLSYDPTNGLKSSGDVFTLSPFALN